MVPFGLFKKKERAEDHASQPLIPQSQPSSISMQEAQALLQEIESSYLGGLSATLAPIKASADKSLREIGALASDMEQEKVKLEGLEQRFKSLVENSRKTIVVTLRREASTELELPKSPNDVRKFREKFEALLKRLGEVSGSHSKILNNFMKKNASRMREEFEALEKLLTQAKSAISEYDQNRAPLVKCGAVLNTLSQKAASIRTGESDMAGAQSEAELLQRESEEVKAELESLKASPEYHAAQIVAQELTRAEGQREDLHKKVSELFSHASRAFTKYSYGVSKETEARLNMMDSEPWRLLYLQDTAAYSSLLSEVRKSISSGKIQLKDSDKAIHYIDLIVQSLPDFQGKASQLDSQLKALNGRDVAAFSRVEQLEQRAAEIAERKSRSEGNAEMLRRQNEEKRAEVGTLLKEASDLLSLVSGKKYSVTS